MNDVKYIGMDVHQATISVAVLDAAGKLILESVLETKASKTARTSPRLTGSERPKMSGYPTYQDLTPLPGRLLMTERFPNS